MSDGNACALQLFVWQECGGDGDGGSGTQVTKITPTLGTVTIGTNQVPIVITFSTTGTFSYVQIVRTSGGVTIVFTVNASQLVLSGSNYIWTDATVVQGTYYTYVVTPYILGSPGIASLPSTVLALAPPTAVSVAGTGTDATHFTLTITGGTNSYSIVNYTYNINGQGFGQGYTTSSTTSQTPTVTLTSGTGLYAAPWTVVVRAINTAGSVDSPASVSFNFYTVLVNSVSYGGTVQGSFSGSLSSGNGIVKGTSTVSGTTYNVYAFGNVGTSGTYVINCTVASATQCYILAVGGGGGGYNSLRGGGGGGGGVSSSTVSIVNGTGSISINIGIGATGSQLSGGNTVITFAGIASTTITAYGGYGATSVGGSSGNPTSYAGGSNQSNAGGGGGGAGQVGTGCIFGDYVGGPGGNGIVVSNLVGVSQFVLAGKIISNLYWGGGGGGAAYSNPAAGGLGGGGGLASGGGGGLNPPTSSNGGVNTGGGGGGNDSGLGGSGIVIIAFTK